MELELVHSASEEDRQNIVEALLAAGVNKDAVADNSYTATMSAALYGQLPILNVLLAAGAGLEFRDADGQTALHLAAVGENPDCIEAILSAGADINARDENEGTALHCAAVGSPACVRVLIAAGADTGVQDTDGFTPLQIAIRAALFVGEADEEIRARITCAVILAEDGADPRSHPTDLTVIVPTPVAAAARRRLARLLPDAVEAAKRLAINPAHVKAFEVLGAPHSVVALMRACAVLLSAEDAVQTMGDPTQKLCAAEASGGLISARRQSGSDVPVWGQPELMGILAIARHQALLVCTAEARAAVEAAQRAVEADREHQQMLVDTRLAPVV